MGLWALPCFTHAIHVAKTYYVEVNDILRPDAPAFFESGVVFEDGTVCKSAQLEILSSASDKSSAHITIFGR